MKTSINLKPTETESLINTTIRQIKDLIVSGQLKPGDRLPAERTLAERFRVGRGYIREAILKLEFYGLLKTSPQSGTYLVGYSLQILDSIFTDIINFNKDDFASLIEGRYYIEINAAKLAAVRRTDEDIAGIKNAMDMFESKVTTGLTAIEEDMLFHIKIAKAAELTK